MCSAGDLSQHLVPRNFVNRVRIVTGERLFFDRVNVRVEIRTTSEEGLNHGVDPPFLPAAFEPHPSISSKITRELKKERGKIRDKCTVGSRYFRSALSSRARKLGRCASRLSKIFTPFASAPQHISRCFLTRFSSPRCRCAFSPTCSVVLEKLF